MRPDIDNLLRHWAAWNKRDTPGCKGYPNMTGFRRLAGATLDWEHDIKDIPFYSNMGDDAALIIDKAVTGLDLDLRTALYLYYIKEYRLNKIEKAMKLKRNQAAEKLHTARRILAHLLLPVAA